jgi:hypothetical protein
MHGGKATLPMAVSDASGDSAVIEDPSAPSGSSAKML